MAVDDSLLDLFVFLSCLICCIQLSVWSNRGSVCRKFEISLYYDLLRGSRGVLFLRGAFWGAKVPQKVASSFLLFSLFLFYLLLYWANHRGSSVDNL